MLKGYQDEFAHPEMFEPFTDLHVDEDSIYSNPILSTLVQQAFQKNQNEIVVLETGDDALLARIHLFRQARKTINIQTFIWSDDESGAFVFSELLKAAGRGVEVRIIVDDLSLRNIPEKVAYLATAHPNIRIKQYNPLADQIKTGADDLVSGYIVNFDLANQRMHNKVIIIDDQLAIIGGRNFANDYFDRGTERNFKDRDVLSIGPVVKEMTDSFMEYWAFKLSVPSEAMLDVAAAIETNRIEIPTQAINYQAERIFQDLSYCSDSPECFHQRITSRAHRADRILFVADKPGKSDSVGTYNVTATTDTFIQLLESAEKSIVMQTPYLVMGGSKLFKKIRKEHPNMEILISSNSLAAADHYYAYAFSFRNKKEYLSKYKWQIFEFKLFPEDLATMVPEIAGIKRSEDYYTSIHSKTYLFDETIVWIGSFNLDPRSVFLNTEAAILIDSECLHEEVRGYIDRDMAKQNSWVIGRRERVPLLGFVSGAMENIMQLLPVLNIWPFRYTTSFELKNGGAPVPFYHENFHDNYRSVGEFPDAGFKANKTKLVNAFFGPAEPII
jgi:phosphatidylserine/phosphatidylglycerophosphate/cardiolipin synthase-like enzyme